ncbi:hypothetical protein EJB05_00526, partial [Eragrostis curvula]
MVEWTRAEKRTFQGVRQSKAGGPSVREPGVYAEMLNLLSGLVKEVGRLDNKLLLMDIDLLKNKLHFSLRNLPKAKASLTVARTAANAINVPPSQQGTSGILHAEEKDYKTAYSYFFEAFDASSSLEDPEAISSFGLHALVSQADDVAGIAQLEEDSIVHRNLSSLYATLLEQNLCRLMESYSRVEIAHIAEMIERAEKKLSQMILDKKFAGTLEQGARCFIIFDDPKTAEIFPTTLETIANVGKVVDSLYMRLAKIMA